MYKHIPVLLDETITFLKPDPTKVFIDGTVGHGGHALAILISGDQKSEIASQKFADGRLLAIDRDDRNLKVAREKLARFGDAVVFINDSFANIKQIASQHHFDQVNGILLDLGFSSAHVDDPDRGFSFQTDGPLDMRYDTSQELTAAKIVNEWDVEELARVFRQYGEEKFAREVAQMIFFRRQSNPFERTAYFASAVASVVPKQGKIHPATRVFQALRIAVNDELGQLERALPNFVDLLAPGGRLVVITFHSLEDRIVKTFMKERSDLLVLTKHVVKPSSEEIKNNPRARSAKLRASEKIPF